MVEVFKTDVGCRDHADRVIDLIHSTYIHYKANFDLEDCDRILRVRSTTGVVEPSCLIGLLRGLGFNAEVLPGDDLL